MVESELIRAFIGPDDRNGAFALVVFEPAPLSDEECADLAVRLGVPATVFVSDAAEGRIRIFGSYGSEISFGGHPVLATIDVLHRRGHAPREIRTKAGSVACARDGEGVNRLIAPAAWSKPWRHYPMASAAEIEALTELPEGEDFTQVWAWMDEAEGTVRARLWAPRINKPEDEACGSASMILAQRLGRPLTVLHGRGSIIHVRPVDDTLVELGGRCAVDDLPADLAKLLDAAYTS
ncbi:PhzF family phenazine biosynthesis protein [Actinomadura oligospora]|uniref:PhzF family phenazine biosynthesis protein n=1 Tax=Actinomadura oligospora TaxID=111804 RepID=UPI0004AE3F0B|nr:PhzF family phenazine biosynthesis protein [Actinomadura oligospora]